MIKIQMEGTVKRVYEEERNGYVKNYLVVEETPAGKYPNVLRFVSKDPANAGEGDKVKVEAFVDGREWNGRDGTVYFTDLKVAKLEVVSASASPAAGAMKTATLQGALDAFLANGGKKPDFALFCERATGKKPIRTAGADYWAMVIAKVNEPAGSDPEPGDDDLPF